MKKVLFDKEEREILDAIETGKWSITPLTKEEKERHAEIARNTFRKDQRMNIRISKIDLEKLKAKAAQEGIPHQTLVASILHKYVSGSLKLA